MYLSLNLSPPRKKQELGVSLVSARASGAFLRSSEHLYYNVFLSVFQEFPWYYSRG